MQSSGKWLFLAGILLLAAGFGINHFYGMKGVLRLEAGKVNSLMTEAALQHPTDSTASDLGFAITLDSIRIQAHIPEFEIKLLKRDTSGQSAPVSGSMSSSILVETFPLEPMKIRAIEKTDLRFRMKAFYPNFEFAYEYPERRDTIEPIAPGITLQLKTREGSPILTLRSDPPKKNTLDDIVSLGASLAYYWIAPMDSIKAAKANTGRQNTIVFSGSDSKMYFLLNDTITEEVFKEGIFYKMPGSDSVGFTILFSFPDMAYLKAVPSTDGTEIRNPVAHVEIWKDGEGATDAFLYPESNVRKGGEFQIPGSDYKIGLRMNPENEKKFCDCHLSIQKNDEDLPQAVTLLAGKTASFEGYRFGIVECHNGQPAGVMMQIQQRPGKIFVIIGFALAFIGIFGFIIRYFGDKRGVN